MKKVIDVVNLNADASCLSTERWLAMLKGEKGSELYSWLSTYVSLKKKISLGITGSTLSDISSFNPESIQLLRENPDIFEFIIRPYAHDIALLRSDEAFLKNLQTGIRMLEELGLSYINFYLPPEFMLTNVQVKLLEDSGVAGTFINYARFKAELHERIPKSPYRLQGIINSSLKCIPFESLLTQAYLNGIHNFSAEQWNRLIINSDLDVTYSWRDGESSFFIPDGTAREKAWLEDEAEQIERVFIANILNDLEFPHAAQNLENPYSYYPTHSFMAWMKESKMLGFLNKITNLEKNLDHLSTNQKYMWLQVINSDILSAIEKSSPVIQLRESANSASSFTFTIWRSTRGVEGEELLYHIENNLEISTSGDSFTEKINRRLNHLTRLF